MEHRITIRSSCQRKGAECSPRYDLIKHLRQTIVMAGDAFPERFGIAGIACMAGCDNPSTVTHHGARKAIVPLHLRVFFQADTKCNFYCCIYLATI